MLRFIAGAESQLDPPVLELVRQDISVARLLHLEQLDSWRLWSTLYSPDALIVDVLREPWQTELVKRIAHTRDGKRRTFEQGGGKVDAHVGVPLGIRLGVDRLGDAVRLHVLGADEDAVTGAEADDDAWDAEEEGLDPVLHELAVEALHVAGVSDLCRCLELYPVDGAALFCGLRVPD